jgi:hypothetical protein
MAFLAEQAYEFEADKRLDVIRFDYDLRMRAPCSRPTSCCAILTPWNMTLLSANGLGNNRCSTSFQWPVNFRNLRTLADEGTVKFSMRLGQLERHFPGLVNLRIASVELQPVALMDLRASVG